MENNFIQTINSLIREELKNNALLANEEQNIYIKKIILDQNFYLKYLNKNKDQLELISLEEELIEKVKKDLANEKEKRIEVVNFFKGLLNNHISIIIGKNGIGKTRWLNSLNFANIISIISDREVRIIVTNNEATNKKILNHEQSDYNFQQAQFDFNNIEKAKHYWNPLLWELISNLNACNNKVTSIDKYSKLRKNFNLINENYLLNENPLKDKWLKYKIKDKGTDLYIENLSLGERHLLFFTIKILNAPENSFILIDEPELGLNEEKLVSFFKKIFNLRKDLKFIFITHSEKFVNIINLEEKTKTYWFKKNIENNFPEIEEIDDNIDLNLYFSILCNSENYEKVFLIEGKYNSIDYHLYNGLFPNFLFIPSNGKEEIIDSMKNLNQAPIFSNIKVFGLIDADTESEIDKKLNNNVFTIKMLTVEFIFFDEDFYREYWNYLVENRLTNLKKNKIMDNNSNIQSIKKTKTSKEMKEKLIKGKTIKQELNNDFYPNLNIGRIINDILKNDNLRKIVIDKLIPDELK